MNGSAKANLRKKQRLWKKYLNAEDNNAYLRHQKISNHLATLTKKSVKFVEREISNQVKDNPKAFWKKQITKGSISSRFRVL